MKHSHKVLLCCLFIGLNITTSYAMLRSRDQSVQTRLGVHFPQTPEMFMDYYNPEFGFGFLYHYAITPFQMVGITLGYQTFGLNRDNVLADVPFLYNQPIPTEADVGVQDNNLQNVIVSGHFIQYLSPRRSNARFYLTLGGGICHTIFEGVDMDMVVLDQTDTFTLIDGDEYTDWILEGGLGVHIFLDLNFFMMMEGKYDLSNIQWDDILNVEDTVLKPGGKVSFASVMIGFGFLF